MLEAQETDFQQKSEAEWTELQRAWGTGFDGRVELARRAARQFGFGEEQLGAIERAIGSKAMMERFAAIGAGLAEDVTPAHESGSRPERVGPDAARAELARLEQDTGFMAACLDGAAPGHAEAVARFGRLFEIAAG
ncbi:MAG: hypothetical protein KDE35_18435 [Geminicoccaceae bacterium]|nr:hypothetical protein [Geminicoccaceae bacterium]